MDIIYVSMGLSFLVGILGLSVYSRIKSSLRLLILFAFSSGLMEIVGSLTSMGGQNNHIYFNVYFVLEFSLMLFALKDLLGQKFRWIALTEYGILIVSYLLEAKHNGLDYLMRHTLITCLAMSAINNLIAIFRTVSQPDSRAAGIYFITVSGLLYYCSVIPRLGLHKSLSDISKSLSLAIDNVNIAADILRFIGMGAGFIYFARVAGNRKNMSQPVPKRAGTYGRK